MGALAPTGFAAADGLTGPKASAYSAARNAAPSMWKPPAILTARSQDQEQARDGVRAGQIVPLSMVLENIRKRYPGKHLDARTIGGEPGNPLRYEVKWLTPDSHRLDIIADAATGKILKVRGQ
jgi:hypothetical protein